MHIATTQKLRADHVANMVDGIEFMHTDSRIPSSVIGLVTKRTSQEYDFINPHPNHDYYNDRFSFPVLVYSTLIGVAITSILLLVALRTQDIRPSDIVSSNATANFRFFLVPPLPVLLGFLGICVLLSLVCEIKRPKGKGYRRWCYVLHFMVYAVNLIPPSFSYAFVIYILMVSGSLYSTISVVHGFRRSQAKKKELQSMQSNWKSSTSEGTVASVDSSLVMSKPKDLVNVKITRSMTSDRSSAPDLE